MKLAFVDWLVAEPMLDAAPAVARLLAEPEDAVRAALDATLRALVMIARRQAATPADADALRRRILAAPFDPRAAPTGIAAPGRLRLAGRPWRDGADWAQRVFGGAALSALATATAGALRIDPDAAGRLAACVVPALLAALADEVVVEGLDAAGLGRLLDEAARRAASDPIAVRLATGLPANAAPDGGPGVGPDPGRGAR